MRSFRSPFRSGNPLALLLIVIAVLYLLFHTLNPEVARFGLDRNAGPKPITARGDLADDEKNTIAVFREASPSVVYITTIELQRNLFSLNVYELPKGTGSGFIWDKEGRIVTNFHVIADAGRIEVTLADHSTWKAALVGAARTAIWPCSGSPRLRINCAPLWWVNPKTCWSDRKSLPSEIPSVLIKP